MRFLILGYGQNNVKISAMDEASHFALYSLWYFRADIWSDACIHTHIHICNGCILGTYAALKVKQRQSASSSSSYFWMKSREIQDWMKYYIPCMMRRGLQKSSVLMNKMSRLAMNVSFLVNMIYYARMKAVMLQFSLLW